MLEEWLTRLFRAAMVAQYPADGVAESHAAVASGAAGAAGAATPVGEERSPWDTTDWGFAKRVAFLRLLKQEARRLKEAGKPDRGSGSGSASRSSHADRHAVRSAVTKGWSPLSENDEHEDDHEGGEGSMAAGLPAMVPKAPGSATNEITNDNDEGDENDPEQMNFAEQGSERTFVGSLPWVILQSRMLVQRLCP